MLAGIREVLVIINPWDKNTFQGVLGDGQSLGINIEYKVQENPRGIADAFIVGQEFIGDDSVCLILGDNIFYGSSLCRLLRSSIKKVESNNSEAIVFGYSVQNPQEYGVVEYDENNIVLSIEEKPDAPKSDCAAVGLYMYSNSVVGVAKKLSPSLRGELEITDLNKQYLKNKKLAFEHLGRGCAWFDTGTHEAFFEAVNFVRTVERRQGLMISNIEEISYRMKYINKEQLGVLIENMGQNYYREYLLRKVLKLGEKSAQN